MDDLRPCRIAGLTSEKGRHLNGLAATAPFFGHNNIKGQDKRVPVQVEGQPQSMSLKYGNLVFFPTGTFDGGIGVGRGTLRDAEFMATAIDNYRQEIISKQPISGGSERSRGNLLAVEAHLKSHSQRPEGIILMCTDLNISIAINKIATGKDAAFCSSQEEEAFRPVQDLIRQQVEQGKLVFANFRPHRIQPDGYDPNTDGQRRWGEARVNAVKRGWFKIYPCPCEQYRDAMEVRFLGDQGTSFLSSNESYLDYGPEEVETYFLNAVALGDAERMNPETLAKVDPQAFWSCILHIEKFCQILQSALPEEKDPLAQWIEILKGVGLSGELWQKVAGASTLAGRLPPPVISGNITTDWSSNMDSDAKHESVSYASAYAALLMMLEAAEAGHNNGIIKPVNFHLLRYYCDSEIGRFVNMLQTLYKNEQELVVNGRQLETGDRGLYLALAVEEAQYGSNDFNYLDVCGHCGNSSSNSNNNLSVCSKCHGAAFCNRDCQKLAWKKHKKKCNSELAQTRRAIHQLATKYGVQLTSEVGRSETNIPPRLIPRPTFPQG